MINKRSKYFIIVASIAILTGLTIFFSNQITSNKSNSGKTLENTKQIEVGDDKMKTKSLLKQLKLDMLRKDIVNILGQPTKDIGSGTYIYQYNLVDESIVTIYFDGNQKLNKMILTYKDGKQDILLEK